jgi:serine/threonine protein kinase
VILLDRHYNKAVDIWSLGCVLSEIIYCSNGLSSSFKFNSDSRYLFQGKSCYPISPLKDAEEDTIGNND